MEKAGSASIGLVNTTPPYTHTYTVEKKGLHMVLWKRNENYHVKKNLPEAKESSSGFGENNVLEGVLPGHSYLGKHSASISLILAYTTTSTMEADVLGLRTTTTFIGLQNEAHVAKRGNKPTWHLWMKSSASFVWFLTSCDIIRWWFYFLPPMPGTDSTPFGSVLATKKVSSLAMKKIWFRPFLFLFLFFSVVLDRVHCDIYNSYSISNISYLNSPPPSLSFASNLNFFFHQAQS
jgi:hypothetical protein